MDTIFEIQQIFRIQDMASGPLAAISAAMGITKDRAGQLSASLGGLAGMLLPLAAALAIVVGGILPAIDVAGDFEKAVSTVGAVARASAGEMDELRQAALDYGATTAWSAMQVAEGEKFLAMAGFTTAQNIAALPAVLNLASAAQEDLGRTADIASDILSAFKLPAEQMSRVSDVLALATATANTNLALLGDTMKYVAPVAKKVGLSFEESAAMAGFLANIGIKGSQAGTTLRAMLTRLAAPTGEAQQTLRALGVEVADMEGNLRSPVLILGEMAKAMNGMGSAQQLGNLKALFDQEAMVGVAALIEEEGVGALSKYVGVLKGASGAAAEMAQRQLDNWSGVKTLIGSAAESLYIGIGSVFLPVLTLVGRGVAVVVSWLARLSQSPVGQFITAVVGSASIATVAFLGWSVASSAVATALPWLTASLAPLAASVLAITWPVWAVVAAVGALYLAWRSNLGGLADTVNVVWSRVSTFAQALSEVWAQFGSGRVVFGGELAEAIHAAGLEDILDAIGSVLLRFRQAWTYAVDAVMSAVGSIDAVVGPAFADVGAAIGSVLSVIGQILASFSFLDSAASSSLSAWALLGHVLGTIVGIGLRALAFGLRLVLAPIQLVAKYITGLVAVIRGQMTWDDVADDLLGVFTGLLSSFASMFPGVTSFLAGVRGAVSNFFSSIGQFLQGAWARISTDAHAAFAMLNPLPFLRRQWDDAISFFSTISLADAGAKLLTTLGDGITSQAGALYQTVRDALGPIGRLLPHSDADEGPLSVLSAAGSALPATIARGILATADLMAQAARTAATATSTALMVATPAIAAPHVTAPTIPSLPDLSATAAWWTVAPAAPDLPELAAPYSVNAVPAPPAPGRTDGDIPTPRAAGASPQRTNPAARQTSSRSTRVSIQQLHVSLPGVTDANDFVAELQRFVEQYDGGQHD